MDMISDTLFDKKPYAILLDIFMSFRLVFGSMFFYRFRREAFYYFIVGNIGIFLALFGWYWLSTHMMAPDHYIGVGLFCSGTIVYSFILLRLSRYINAPPRPAHDILEWMLITTTFMIGIVFLSLWISSNKMSYVPEHLTYIFHLLFYMFFMSYNTPNPFKVITCFDDVNIPEQCTSLV